MRTLKLVVATIITPFAAIALILCDNCNSKSIQQTEIYNFFSKVPSVRGEIEPRTIKRNMATSSGQTCRQFQYED